jgi:hypothetical protein
MVIRIKRCPSWNPLYLRILTMAQNFAIAPTSQLITLITTLSYVESITITSTSKTWSSQVMYKLVHNDILDVRAYHHFLHTMCPLFQMKAYMTLLMVSCVVIHWPLNRQCARCMPNVSNPCPHSHTKRLNVEGWIKPRQKCIIEVKVKCAMQNKWIDGLTIKYNPTFLPEQEWQ